MKISKSIIIGSLFMLGALSVTQARADVAADLTKNYNAVVSDCGSVGRPSFLCSGVMIRATKPSTKYHAWDPSPSSITRGGVSFSYFRRDIKLDTLVFGYNSGIIFYPYSTLQEDKLHPEVLCSFPLDGATFGRTGIGACGASKTFPSDSGSCQSLGINTVDAWYKHYLSVPDTDNDRNEHQCGFSLAIGTSNSANAFNTSINVQKFLFPSGVSLFQNEIVVSTWDVDANGLTVSPEKLPIQAFFYTDQEGLVNAQYYQKDYFTQTKVLVPVVQVIFPKNSTGDVRFKYSESDQNKVTCTMD